MVAPSKIEETPKATYDRKSELQAFDDTKAGVKGLFDAGVTKLPRIFIHPPESLKDIKTPAKTQFNFPVIDFEGFEKDPSARENVVNRVREAAETWGFFQVVNHGIPPNILEEILDGVGRFMDQETEIKKQYYTRDFTQNIYFLCNFDLFSSPAANWRDTLYCNCAPTPPNPEELPSVCRYVDCGKYQLKILVYSSSYFCRFIFDCKFL